MFFLNLNLNLIGIFEAVKEELGLVDIWTIRNPETKMYTWRSLNSVIQRCLDFFLISSALQPMVACAEIIPTVGTDHSSVSIKLMSQEFQPHGNGYWKVNNSLLEDKNYVTEIKDKISQWKNEIRVH